MDVSVNWFDAHLVGWEGKKLDTFFQRIWKLSEIIFFKSIIFQPGSVMFTKFFLKGNSVNLKNCQILHHSVLHNIYYIIPDGSD